MAYCGTGTSHARPTSPAVSYLVGAAAVAVTVETLGLSAVWADLIAYAAGQTFTTATFCAADPPAMPVWGITDVADIIGGTPATGPVGWQKLADLIAIGAWLTFCECVAPAVVTLPTPPTYPAGAPVLTSPSIPTLTASPCVDKSASWTVQIPTSSTSNTPIDLTAALYPTVGVPIVVQSQIGFFQNAYPIPPGSSFLSLTATSDQATAFSDVVIYLWSDATHAVDGNALFFSHWASPTTKTYKTLPANANYLSVIAFDGWPNQHNVEHVQAELKMYCAGAAPGAAVQPCCPPDPVLMAQLQAIYKTVTMLQRYAVPFAYINGPTHSGLSGNGMLTLPTGCLGIRVDITTLPGRLGQEAGDPIEYFDVGWYSWGDASGFLSREFISHDPQLSFPPKAQQMTRWGYSLLPGVVASVTELYAEP